MDANFARTSTKTGPDGVTTAQIVAAVNGLENQINGLNGNIASLEKALCMVLTPVPPAACGNTGECAGVKSDGSISPLLQRLCLLGADVAQISANVETLIRRLEV